MGCISFITFDAKQADAYEPPVPVNIELLILLKSISSNLLIALLFKAFNDLDFKLLTFILHLLTGFLTTNVKLSHVHSSFTFFIYNSFIYFLINYYLITITYG